MNGGQNPSIDSICEATGMTANDVVAVFENNGFLRWSPETESYKVIIEEFQLKQFQEKKAGKQVLRADFQYLRWRPFTCTR